MSEWPIHDVDEVIKHVTVEDEKVVTLTVIDNGGSDLFSRYSKFSKMQRIIAYCLRFINNARCKNQNKQIGNLSSREIFNATILICKMIQRREFYSEIVSLDKNKNVSNKSKFSPFWMADY